MGRCTAHSKRSGERCKNTASHGYPVCRFHGAGSKNKPGGRPIVHGRYSKNLPIRLAAKYAEALADPDLLVLRDELALVDARQGELLERLDSGESASRWKAVQTAHTGLQAAIGAKDSRIFLAAMAALGEAVKAGGSDSALWREIGEVVEQRRKLSESEHKRLVAMQQVVTVDRAMILLGAVVSVIQRHVVDRETLALISGEIRDLSMVGADVP